MTKSPLSPELTNDILAYIAMLTGPGADAWDLEPLSAARAREIAIAGAGRCFGERIRAELSAA